MKLEIKTGLIYGRLTVLKEGEPFLLPSGQKNRSVLCKCECGNEITVRLLHLTRNRTNSCGCILKVKKGLSGTPLLKVWRQMISRCSETEKSDKNKRFYFDKGIRVSDEFKDWEFFYNWALKNGYKKGLQIDRINSKKDYSSKNCRWVTSKINGNNRENTFTVLYDGNIEPIMLVLDRLNKSENYSTIFRRIKRGWNAQKAIDTPIKKGNYKTKTTLKKLTNLTGV